MTDPTPAPEPTPYAAAPAPAPAGTDYPGKTLGIVGVVFAILAPIIGFILGLVARGQSKKAGYKNTPATVAIVIGLVLTILYIVGIILAVVLGAAAVSSVISDACVGYDSGTILDLGNGTTVTCP